MKIITCLLLLLSVNLHAQCFDCNKNVGNWTNDSAMDVEKLPDGILFLVGNGGFTSNYINKYDFNCNLLWSKTFGYFDVDVQSVTSDPAGNIYVLIHDQYSTNGGLGPYNYSGFMMSPGMNIYKLDPQGNIIWTRHIGPGTGLRMQNIVFSQNELYLTGTFYGILTVGGTTLFTHPYTDEGRAFIAKYDTNGTFTNAIELGNGSDVFSVSEVDPQGNTYMTYYERNYAYSRLVKFDANLNLVWSVDLTTASPGNSYPSIYNPTGIRFNAENQKLYLWGGMNLSVNIMGNPFVISTNNGVFQSALTEFDTSTGALTNIRRFDNNSYQSVPAILGTYVKRGAFMKEKSGYLYVFTSFTGTLAFPNNTATSTTYNGGTLNSENLLLFKVKLSDFTPEMIFQSHGVSNLNHVVSDLPAEIVFNGDDLYLTSTFGSKPLTINGSLINNNSGNSNSDGMLYKYNILNAPNSGTIAATHTCLNDQTAFNVAGTYTSIAWNFGEPSSANNTSVAIAPLHQYAAAGTYHVTAVVTCGAITQTIQKDVVITPLPYLNTIPALTACEDSQGLGISTAFDTSQLNAALIGSQTNISLTFSTAAGLPLPSPLPNPFTNTVANNQTVVVRAFFTQNPGCYVEKNIAFTTLAAPNEPIAVPEQSFCIQQQALLSDLAITGNNIRWYNTPTGGSQILGNPMLVDGYTYYASQYSGTCESTRAPVLVHVYDTPAPIGIASQTFCTSQNPVLSDIAMFGSAVQWYANATGNTAVPITSALLNGATYYASQTLNGCESSVRTAVNVNFIATLNANDYAQYVCDDSNDGTELIDLSLFNQQLLTNASTNTFTFYGSQLGAENATASELINSPSQFPLIAGLNTVYVRITNPNGCNQSVKLSLTLVPVPVIATPDIVAVCENKLVTIDAGTGFDSYLWSNGATTESIVVSQAGSFSVTVGINYGGIFCTASKTIEVVLSNAAVITSVAISDWTDSNNIITIDVTGLGDYMYSLDGSTYQDSNTFTGVPSGVHTVYVKDKNGCGVMTKEVTLLSYPKYFTPNGDGFNDLWSIKFSEYEPGLVVSIFDRYGKLVHKMSNDSSWNGRYIDRALPADDYWFIVARANGKEYRGHFSLKR